MSAPSADLGNALIEHNFRFHRTGVVAAGANRSTRARDLAMFNPCSFHCVAVRRNWIGPPIGDVGGNR
jgi:hypothetical protein